MRADRLLSILLLLQAGRRVTAKELAGRLEVSERTILRDMDALSGAGIPVVAERGTKGGWGLLNGYQTKLTGLNAAEIQSLFLARPPRLMADLGIGKDAEAAMIKLAATLPEAARSRADFARERILVDARGWRDPAEPVASLPLLLDALWRERQVRFVYQRVLGEPGERLVSPLGLVAKGSTWYLIATAADEPRTYRVSRVHEAAVLDTPAHRPPKFDLAAYWHNAATEFREKLPRYYATFRAAPSVMQWVRYRGWRLEEGSPEGDAVRIRLRFDAEEEAVQFGLSFGDGVEVLEPAELRERVERSAAAIVQLYRGGATEPAARR